MQPRDALKTHFGYDSFRGQQQAVIDHVLGAEHALVIMPTGMGKSLCYQIPALVHAAVDRGSDEATGLTLVISPLIALMKDQVDALVARGISAAYINSSLSRSERESRYKGVGDGEFDLLYVTPERFRKPEFLEVIGRRQIRLLAVDEAHCISEWGHDFRPDYTRLAEFRSLLEDPTTIALTATATPEVQTDIIRQLGLKESDIRMFHEGIDRPNLSLEVREVWDVDDKLAAIQSVIQDEEMSEGSGIVYFTLIRTLCEFSDRLRELGVPHYVYHGDLPRDQRRSVQNQFMQGDRTLVLATNAFGMGIDKDSIRYVIHADVPGSVESYYQEIGRAGRDGLPSRCLLLYDESDLATQMEFINWSNPDASFYDRVYHLLIEEREKIDAFGHGWLQEKLRAKHDHRMETALSMLERFGAVDIEQNPWKLRVVGSLPDQLNDEERLANKMKRDQQKLYEMVRYVRHEGDRKAFIHEYFGLPYHGDDGE